MSGTTATRGFTLIELLIVVAIIAILAAIAVPNFLEAQVRSKLSRSLADMRSISVALESYAVDRNTYPAMWIGNSPLPGHQRLNLLTSPVSYMTNVPTDVFADEPADPGTWYYHKDAYVYHRLEDRDPDQRDNWGFSIVINEARSHGAKWGLTGRGPNRTFDCGGSRSVAPPGSARYDNEYDSTNGTVSWGDVFRFGP